MLKHVEGSAQRLGNVKMSLNWEPVQRIAYTIELHPAEPESVFQDVLSPSPTFTVKQSLVNEFMLVPST